MSREHRMIGYIMESAVVRGDFAPHRVNDAVLATLPFEDAENPPLQQSMFYAPPIEHSNLQFSGSRIRCFALYRNHFQESLNKWLEKFERILKQMHWSRVEIRVDGLELSVDIRYTPKGRPFSGPERREPVSKWDFQVTEVRGDMDNILLDLQGRPGFTSGEIHDDTDRLLRRLRSTVHSARALVDGKTTLDFDTDEVLVRALHHMALEIRYCVSNLRSNSRPNVAGMDWQAFDFLNWSTLTRSIWHFPIPNFGHTVGKHLASELEKIEKRLADR